MRVTMVDNKTGKTTRLAKLALNEAFLCERDSARPTYYQLVTEDNYEACRAEDDGMFLRP